jgi:uncharacterized protein YfiM (DUF2279 family)
MIRRNWNCNHYFLPVLLFLYVLAAGNLQAQVTEYQTDVSRRGTSAGAMLEIGVGARAEALGGAFVAIADDPSALYWNPAGIINIPSLSLQATKTDWLVGTNFNALDMVIPLPSLSSALGFHLAMLDYGENPVRTIFRPEGTGEVYSASDMVAGLYWAMSITNSFSVGLGVKYFQERIWHVSGSTIAIDLAVLYDTPLKGLRLGGSISNLGPEFGLQGRDLTRTADIDGIKDEYYNNDNVPIELATETYPLPMLFRFGVSYLLDFSEDYTVQMAANVNHPSDDKESLDLGAEIKLWEIVFLRAGYQSLFLDYAANGLALGGGLKYTLGDIVTLSVDYAYTDWSILASTNRFTLGVAAAL